MVIMILDYGPCGVPGGAIIAMHAMPLAVKKVENIKRYSEDGGWDMEKVLLNLNEVCEYLGLGKTKTREIMTKTKNPFTVRIGNRLYANKILLDRWINDKSGV